MIREWRTVTAHLLTGFLGSGKTTLLRCILTLPELAGTAVLTTESGGRARPSAGREGRGPDRPAQERLRVLLDPRRSARSLAREHTELSVPRGR